MTPILPKTLFLSQTMILSNYSIANGTAKAPVTNSGLPPAFYLGLLISLAIFTFFVCAVATIIYFYYLRDETPDELHNELKEIYKETANDCKRNIDRRYKPQRMFWFDFLDIFTTYVPVYIVANVDGKITVVKKIGGYNGETLTMDGYMALRLTKWRFGLFDIHKIVKFPNIKKIKLHTLNELGKDAEVIINLPNIDIIKGNDAIIVSGVADIVQRTESGYFYGIVIDKLGKQIDYYQANFENERDLVAMKINYESLDTYSQNIKRSARMNPYTTHKEIKWEHEEKKEVEK